MAGSFGVKKRAEYNVINDIPAARKFFAECPSPIVLTPFEIGKQVVYPGRSIAEDFGWAEHHPMVEASQGLSRDALRPSYVGRDATPTSCRTSRRRSRLSIPGRITVDEQGLHLLYARQGGTAPLITASDRQAGIILGYFRVRCPNGRCVTCDSLSKEAQMHLVCTSF